MRCLRLLVFLAAILGSVAPASAQFGKPSVSQQISLGERVADDVRKHYKVLPDSDPRVVELRKVGVRLLANIHDKETWHFTFDVIDGKEINAFSLPGGPTFFFTGLMDKLKTEDELAGVLGHEMTHVRRQHWAHQYAADMNRSLLLGLGLVFLHANETMADLASLGDQAVFELPFSRGEEHQADDGGYDLMTDAGYNPIGMVHVFQLLQATEPGGSQPEWMSDHPADKNRIDFLQGRIAKDKRTFPMETPLPSFEG